MLHSSGGLHSCGEWRCGGVGYGLGLRLLARGGSGDELVSAVVMR